MKFTRSTKVCAGELCGVISPKNFEAGFKKNHGCSGGVKSLENIKFSLRTRKKQRKSMSFITYDEGNSRKIGSFNSLWNNPARFETFYKL